MKNIIILIVAIGLLNIASAQLAPGFVYLRDIDPTIL